MNTQRSYVSSDSGKLEGFCCIFCKYLQKEDFIKENIRDSSLMFSLMKIQCHPIFYNKFEKVIVAPMK